MARLLAALATRGSISGTGCGVIAEPFVPPQPGSARVCVVQSQHRGTGRSAADGSGIGRIVAQSKADLLVLYGFAEASDEFARLRSATGLKHAFSAGVDRASSLMLLGRGPLDEKIVIGFSARDPRSHALICSMKVGGRTLRIGSLSMGSPLRRCQDVRNGVSSLLRSRVPVQLVTGNGGRWLLRAMAPPEFSLLPRPGPLPLMLDMALGQP